jgi:dienelactone hydrolase
MVGLSPKVRELPVLLGKQASLVGILTEASQADPVKDAPVIVLLNAGIIHRVGPNRIYVQLARTLAAAGYTSLRFDLSGIGDSPNRADALPPLESALSDIREVLDWLAANKNAHRFILLGLCAGADHSILYASSDRRVVGVALLDPSIPRTKGFHRNEFRRKLSSLVQKPPAEALSSIASFVKRALRAKPDPGPAESEPVEPGLNDDELRSQFEPHYRQCVLAGVKILALFTGGLQANHNYREQFIDAFSGVAFGDRLTLEYAPQVDHTFSLEANRELLQQTVLRWLQTASFSQADRVEQPGHSK